MVLKTEVKSSLMGDVMEVLLSEGSSGMARIFGVLLNEAMKIEREAALGAGRYERSEDRQGYANGFKERIIQTRSGPVPIAIPQVRGMTFYPSSLEKGCRSEQALKLAMAQMYVEGVSTRKVSEITEKLCGFEVSASQVSRCAALLDEELIKFRERPLGEFPYVFLDARYEKCRITGQVIDVAVLVAIGVNSRGCREVLGISVELSEAEVHWRNFLQSLQKRGICGIKMIISDDHAGLGAARRAVFPTVVYQRCQFHFAQNAQSYAPTKAMKPEIADAVRSIFQSSTKESALDRVRFVALEFAEKAPKFVSWLEQNVHQCLNVYQEPEKFRKKLRTVNPLELLNREIKRRTRVARIFPNEQSISRLVTAVLVEIHDDWVGSQKRYMNFD
jgi:putative transposase